MTPKTKLFVILWLAGMAGVLSFLLVDLSKLLAYFPVPAGTELPSIWVLKLVGLIQPTVLLSLAVLIGVALASRIGLSSPVAEAAAGNGQLGSALKPQIHPGVIGGLMGGASICLIWILWKPFLPQEFVTRALAFSNVLPLSTRLLYGGITEELLLRWGVMTLLAWAAWRLLQSGQGKPRPIYLVSAIIISSVVFGLGHLPVAFALSSEVTASLVFYTVSVNALFGLIAGYLYWKKGLESAVIAHMLAHVVIVTVSYFGI